MEKSQLGYPETRHRDTVISANYWIGPVAMKSRSRFLLRLAGVPRSRQTGISPSNRASPAHVTTPLESPALLCFMNEELRK